MEPITIPTVLDDADRQEMDDLADQVEARIDAFANVGAIDAQTYQFAKQLGYAL